MPTKHTPEQLAALEEFERASESHDLTALGFGRKWKANEHVVVAYKEIKRLRLVSALTPTELARARRSLAFISS